MKSVQPDISVPPAAAIHKARHIADHQA